MKKYRYTVAEAKHVQQHGIDLTIYGTDVPTASIVHVSVKKGHFQEFYNEKSWFMYYVISGKGTFVLDDEKIEVRETDLIVVPPKTRVFTILVPWK